MNREKHAHETNRKEMKKKAGKSKTKTNEDKVWERFTIERKNMRSVEVSNACIRMERPVYDAFNIYDAYACNYK